MKAFNHRTTKGKIGIAASLLLWMFLLTFVQAAFSQTITDLKAIQTANMKVYFNADSLDADFPALNDGDQMTENFDEWSGNARNLEAITGTNPLFEENELGTRPAIHFVTAVSDRLEDTEPVVAGAEYYKYMHDGTGMTVMIIFNWMHDSNGINDLQSIFNTTGSTNNPGIQMVIDNRSNISRYELPHMIAKAAGGTNVATLWNTGVIDTLNHLIPAGKWNMAVMTYEEGLPGDDEAYWFNGVKWGTSDDADAPSSANANGSLLFGASSTGTEKADFTMYAFASWDVALSDAEVDQAWAWCVDSLGMASTNIIPESAQMLGGANTGGVLPRIWEQGQPHKTDGEATADTVFWDTFTDANGTVLDDHTPDQDDSGIGWFNYSDDPDIVDVQIQSNRYNIVVAGAERSLMNAGTADVYIEANVEFHDDVGSFDDSGIVFRADTVGHNSNWIEFTLWQGTVNTMQIRRVIDGSEVVIAEDDLYGQDYEIEFQTMYVWARNDTIIAGLRGGGLQLSVVSSTHIDHTFHGMSASDDAVNEATDFLVISLDAQAPAAESSDVDEERRRGRRRTRARN